MRWIPVSVGLLLGPLVASACSGEEGSSASALPTEPPAGPGVPAASAPAPSADASSSEAPSGDAAPADTGTPGPGYPRTYRNSLGVCWTDAACKRALTVAHGGDWSYTGNPYASNAAISAAYANGADGVKIDARMTKDGVAVVAHSSPFEAYESLDCLGRKVEEMTAAEVTRCHRVPSQTETYQRLDDVLAYLRGKMVAQICVKRPVETAALAAAVLAAGAEDYAFLELSTADLATRVPAIPNGDRLYYLVNVEAPSEVDELLGTIKNPRAFMYEFAADVPVSGLVATRLHPAGIRSFTYDKGAVTVPAIAGLFGAGFDVVSTNATAAAIQARVQVNTARGVSPP